MEANKNGFGESIGHGGAFVEGGIGVGVARHQDAIAMLHQLSAKDPSQRQYKVLFVHAARAARTIVRTSVRRIDDDNGSCGGRRVLSGAGRSAKTRLRLGRLRKSPGGSRIARASSTADKESTTSCRNQNCKGNEVG